MKSRVVEVEMFRASKGTNRFKLNQKVWITDNFANHLYVTSKWRGKGRYTRSVLRKWDNKWENLNPVIGEIKRVEISVEFAEKLGCIPPL